MEGKPKQKMKKFMAHASLTFAASSLVWARSRDHAEELAYEHMGDWWGSGYMEWWLTDPKGAHVADLDREESECYDDEEIDDDGVVRDPAGNIVEVPSPSASYPGLMDDEEDEPPRKRRSRAKEPPRPAVVPPLPGLELYTVEGRGFAEQHLFDLEAPSIRAAVRMAREWVEKQPEVLGGLWDDLGIMVEAEPRHLRLAEHEEAKNHHWTKKEWARWDDDPDSEYDEDDNWDDDEEEGEDGEE